jgi:ferredoxin-type protein NapF
MSASRRGFLTGRLSAVRRHEQRPPWAIDAAAFEARCTRCGDCVRACPTGIVVAGGGGFPKVDFGRGECTFCGDCAMACTAAVLRREAGATPWSLTVTIADTCLAGHGVECRVCGETCDTGAIRFRPQLGGVARPQLEAARCTGCGACYAPCPVSAIALANEVEMNA